MNKKNPAAVAALKMNADWTAKQQRIIGKLRSEQLEQSRRQANSSGKFGDDAKELVRLEALAFDAAANFARDLLFKPIDDGLRKLWEGQADFHNDMIVDGYDGKLDVRLGLNPPFEKLLVVHIMMSVSQIIFALDLADQIESRFLPTGAVETDFFDPVTCDLETMVAQGIRFAS
jgi:hypothetical protein